jgi:hypothetical protein
MALVQVPQANQTLAQTQQPILNNFGAIDAAFQVDHVDYNLGNQGKHEAIHFVNQQIAPNAPVTIGGEVSLYAAPSILGAGNPPALWYKPQNGNAAINGIDFTTYGAGGPNNTGWLRLPSGIIMKWGAVQITNDGTVLQTIVYPVNANTPVFNNVFALQLTPTNPTSGASTINVQMTVGSFANPLQFTVGVGKITGPLPATSVCNYLAIGN